jgi:hypothetical protein
MANDRLYIRCTECGDYEFLAKWSPSPGRIFAPRAVIDQFVCNHINSCQKGDGAMTPPMCIVFDNEDTFCAAGGKIGGSPNGNVNKDRTS